MKDDLILHVHLFGDLQLVVSLHLLQQPVLAAAVQHPLLDAAGVPRHRIYEDWKKNSCAYIKAAIISQYQNQFVQNCKHRVTLAVTQTSCMSLFLYETQWF